MLYRMLWRVEVGAKKAVEDKIADSILIELRQAGLKLDALYRKEIFLIEGEIDKPAIQRIGCELLIDGVMQDFDVYDAKAPPKCDDILSAILIFKKQGVMDPVEASAKKAIKEIGFDATGVRIGVKYLLRTTSSESEVLSIVKKILANAVIDDVFFGEKAFGTLKSDRKYEFKLIEIPLAKASDDELMEISKGHNLSLSLLEMKAIRDYFRKIGRTPTDAELETIAQTWSEHCKHKVFNSDIEMDGEVVHNLFKSTIAKATLELAKPWCVSVFKDNAGIVEFDRNFNICFKVETHNHPSAIEPYGGANTGIGGVIRDCLGAGLGAKPILNTDIFCVGLPDTLPEKLPAGTIHPKKLLQGVVSGVRDYGNRMGIPTVNGAVFFDNRYIGNPLVYCGTLGVIPKGCTEKSAKNGDAIVLVGGRTGRDGIHGATFSSVGLTEKSEELSSGAVQIGNAITEKKVLDVILTARDTGLYSAITDCGAGGLSSAVGEMGAELGAEVDLEKVPLKYEGLSYTEIWISEAQERMVLSVPQKNVGKLLEVCKAEDVEAVVVGAFTNDKKLHLRYNGKTVGILDMDFLHNGVPKTTRKAVWAKPSFKEPQFEDKKDYGDDLLKILSSFNVASKEWIIRQYDHEVQGGSVIKSLVGIGSDAPSDASVIRPVLGSNKGVVVANGMNPKYGDIDTYWMAASAIDEAIRNVVAVGGDPEHLSLLDNFSWGNPDKPEILGALVRATEACHYTALGYGTPFISGKDSLYNEFVVDGRAITIPHSLLISAVSVIEDVNKCVTMDLKRSDSFIYIIGLTKRELGGSHFYALHNEVGNSVPMVETVVGRKTFSTIHKAISKGLILSCHDCSEGGIAVAVAEMAFGGEVGVELSLDKVPAANNVIIYYMTNVIRKAPVSKDVYKDYEILFSESNSRFVVEVSKKNKAKFEKLFSGIVPVNCVGKTTPSKKLAIYGLKGNLVIDKPIYDLKEAWIKPLRW